MLHWTRHGNYFIYNFFLPYSDKHMIDFFFFIKLEFTYTTIFDTMLNCADNLKQICYHI